MAETCGQRLLALPIYLRMWLLRGAYFYRGGLNQRGQRVMSRYVLQVTGAEGLVCNLAGGLLHRLMPLGQHLTGGRFIAGGLKNLVGGQVKAAGPAHLPQRIFSRAFFQQQGYFAAGLLNLLLGQQSAGQAGLSL